MNNVLITGGTKGLGLSMAEHCLKEGYNVIVSARSCSDRLARLMDENNAVHFYPFDLSQADGHQEFIRNIVKEHGGLYGFVNNAAIGLDGVLGTMHDSEIAKMIQVNTTSSILLTKYVSRSMLIKRTGRIVNVSSIIASTGFSGLSVYAATKSAMIGFSKSLARELGKAGITVNVVSPGYMETEMTKGLDEDKIKKIVRRSPMNRLVHLEEVAHTVSYLLSDAASGITGTNITVDAGSTA